MKKLIFLMILGMITLISYSQNQRQFIGYIDASKSLTTKTVSMSNIQAGILFIYPKNMVGSGGYYSIYLGADIDNSGTIDDNEYTLWSNHSITSNLSQSWDIGNLPCESLKITLTKGSLTGGKIYISLMYKPQK